MVPIFFKLSFSPLVFLQSLQSLCFYVILYVSTIFSKINIWKSFCFLSFFDSVRCSRSTKCQYSYSFVYPVRLSISLDLHLYSQGKTFKLLSDRQNLKYVVVLVSFLNILGSVKSVSGLFVNLVGQKKLKLLRLVYL